MVIRKKYSDKVSKDFGMIYLTMGQYMESGLFRNI